MTLPTMANMTNAAPQPGQQIVAILSVDTVNMTAQGQSRQGSVSIVIDLRYHVGAVHVMPSVGEQWTIKRFSTAWVLVSKLPQNTAELLTPPVEGQVQVGSTGTTQGPLHLNGSQVTVNAPLAVQTTTALTRPDPSQYPPGTHIYDTDLGRPIWSNGTDWHDAAGHTFYVADVDLSVTAADPATTHWAAKADAGLTITATQSNTVKAHAQVDAALAVTAESDPTMQAGNHLTANAQLSVTTSSDGSTDLAVNVDAEQIVTMTPPTVMSRGQGMDSSRSLNVQFAAAGEKTFDTEQQATATTTAAMRQEVNADSALNFITASTTADFAHDMSADADLAVTAESGAGVPTDLTADSWQMIQASRTAEATSSADVHHDLTANSSLDTTVTTTTEAAHGTSADAELEVTAEPDADPAQPQDLTADAWQMIHAYRTGEVE